MVLHRNRMLLSADGNIHRNLPLGGDVEKWEDYPERDEDGRAFRVLHAGLTKDGVQRYVRDYKPYETDDEALD